MGLITVYSNNVTICTEKMPTNTAIKLKETDLRPTTKGIANKTYLINMEINPIKLDL
jgi:hypothetical protein